MKRVKLNPVGLDGNAFVLLGAFVKAARDQGWNKVEIAKVTDDAKSGDYYHLLQVLATNTEPEDDDEDTEYCDECGEPSDDCTCEDEELDVDDEDEELDVDDEEEEG